LPNCTFTEYYLRTRCIHTEADGVKDIDHMSGDELNLLRRQLNQALQEVGAAEHQLVCGAKEVAKEPSTPTELKALKDLLEEALKNLEAKLKGPRQPDKPGAKG
jgi:hypothetical protein